ncbi:hypothetical protein MBRA_04226 [Methylobacterium brachiatum]|nr:hypothetical protein MBRA_04226 [Methylobacterium brachiatum]
MIATDVGETTGVEWISCSFPVIGKDSANSRHSAGWMSRPFSPCEFSSTATLPIPFMAPRDTT